MLADPTVTIALLVAATALCAAVSLRFADPVYAAVFVWAEIGIAVAKPGQPKLQAVAYALAGVYALLGLRSGLVAARSRTLLQ